MHAYACQLSKFANYIATEVCACEQERTSTSPSLRVLASGSIIVYMWLLNVPLPLLKKHMNGMMHTQTMQHTSIRTRVHDLLFAAYHLRHALDRHARGALACSNNRMYNANTPIHIHVYTCLHDACTRAYVHADTRSSLLLMAVTQSSDTCGASLCQQHSYRSAWQHSHCKSHVNRRYRDT